MLAENFRADPGRVGRLKELFQDPTLATALIVLKDERLFTDVSLDAKEVESVRRLSYLAGAHDTVDLLLSLAEPLPKERPEPEPDWGVKKDEFIGTA